MAHAVHRLPVELVRLIFEIPTDYFTMTVLASICRSSNAWITPRLYSTMVIDTPKAGQCFIYLLRSKPASFFEPVKRLSLTEESILLWQTARQNCVRHVMKRFVAAFCCVEDLQAPVPVVFYLHTRGDFVPGPRRVWYSPHLEKLEWPETAQQDGTAINKAQLAHVQRMHFDLYHSSFIVALAVSSTDYTTPTHLTHTSYSVISTYANDPIHADQISYSINLQLASLPDLRRVTIRIQGTPASVRKSELWTKLAGLEDERVFVGCEEDRMICWIQNSVTRFANTTDWEDDYWQFGEQVWRRPKVEHENSRVH